MEAACGLKEDGTLARKPDAVAGDKGYTGKTNRQWLAGYQIQDVIPTKTNEQRDPNFDRELYRKRNIVERFIGWLKENRRIAMRFEKLAVHFLAMIQIAAILRLMRILAKADANCVLSGQELRGKRTAFAF
jgi:transposase